MVMRVDEEERWILIDDSDILQWGPKEKQDVLRIVTKKARCWCKNRDTFIGQKTLGEFNPWPEDLMKLIRRTQHCVHGSHQSSKRGCRQSSRDLRQQILCQIEFKYTIFNIGI